MDPNILLMTLVIALEPVPVLAGVLLLATERGRPKAIGFGLGWAFALAVIGLAAVAVDGVVSTSSTSSTASAVVDIGLGIALFVYGAVIRARANRGVAGSTPGWMRRLDTMKPIAAFALGMFLPPYLIAVAVGNEIVQSGLGSTQEVVAVLLYVVIGSLGVLVPILVTVVRPATADATLGSWRAWLEVNWQIVLAWLLLAIGVYLVVKGVVEL